LKFSTWIENRAADAVMGAIGADADEKDKVMGRKTTYFGSDIRSRLKGLGVVKNSGDYANIAKGIDDGITVGELIRRLKD
jgi:hypothetical protein